jgi:hypothetical protein
VAVGLSGPKLWSPATPALYRAVAEVLAGGAVVDRVEQAFGIRKIEIDVETGLRVNGVPYEMKGACVHHDNGPLGAAAIDRAEERQVEVLKAAGFDAIRTSVFSRQSSIATHRQRARTRAVISKVVGGFSPSPSVWSISWMTMDSASEEFPASTSAKRLLRRPPAAGQTNTGGSPGIEARATVFRWQSGTGDPCRKGSICRYSAALTPHVSRFSASVRPLRSRKSVRIFRHSASRSLRTAPDRACSTAAAS